MTVYLVGAGPGDPGLITVRGAELLRNAEVVVHDRLSAASLLDLVPEGAEIINVGKSSTGPSVPQERINELLVEHGVTGQHVVRLKGGDPFIFARGAEEAAALIAAGVEYEIVPGVTSAIAVPAYAGIPVTRRYSSTSLTIVTGHEDPTKVRTEVDWRSLAKVGGTIVVLMGVKNLPFIAEELVAGGLSPDTPAAAVRWGTTSAQHTTRATLTTLADHPLKPPSTIVIGDVVDSELDWFERRPLLGRTVVVTRAAEQASRLSVKLRAAGADVVEVPTIAIVDPADGGAELRSALAGVSDVDWLIVTSPNGARRLAAEIRDGCDLAGVQIAAIGPGTSAVLAEGGLIADLLPERYVAEGLLEAMPAPPAEGGSVLIVRAEVARDLLPEGLADAGWNVEIATAYRNVAVDISEDQLAAIAGADAICFTSASSARNFAAAAGAGSAPPVVASIGPITSAAAVEAGLAVSAEATEHTLDGLVAAVVTATSRP